MPDKDQLPNAPRNRVLSLLGFGTAVLATTAVILSLTVNLDRDVASILRDGAVVAIVAYLMLAVDLRGRQRHAQTHAMLAAVMREVMQRPEIPEQRTRPITRG